MKRTSPRERRLLADFQSLQQLQQESTIFSFSAAGRVPEKYRLIFQGKGIHRDANEAILPQDRHEVMIELGAAYPRMVPNMAWLTPVFHPNISHSGVICLGGYGNHWAPGLALSEICEMLWDMIRYKNFDPGSPYNREAAAWVKAQDASRFPLDYRPLRDRVAREAQAHRRSSDSIKSATDKSRSNPSPHPPDLSGQTPNNNPAPVDGIQILSVGGSSRSSEPDILFIE